jgi:hypothetical protein
MSAIQSMNTQSTAYWDIRVDWHKSYIENGEALWLFDADADNGIFNPELWVSREGMIDLINRLAQLYK